MADVTFTAVTQPAPACYPPDTNALLTMIATLGLKGTIPDSSGGGVFVGSSQPDSSLTQKVWFRTDAAGRPAGAYLFYNGNWRKCYTGSIGDIKLYIGPFNGVFDGTGRGVIGGLAGASGSYDEDGWQVCNGQNSTPNLDGYFPGGAMWNGSAWVSNADGISHKGSGGVRQIQVLAKNLPQLLVQHAQKSIGAAGTGFDFLIASSTGGEGVLDFAVTNTGPATPLNTVPPFYAMAYLMFIGYA